MRMPPTLGSANGLSNNTVSRFSCKVLSVSQLLAFVQGSEQERRMVAFPGASGKGEEQKLD